MSALWQTRRAVRAGALLLLGALAIHWLRYLLAYGSHPTRELNRQGHSYLVDLVPILTTIAAGLLLAAGVLRLAAPKQPSGPSGRLGPRCGAYGLALLLIFSAQELSEGFLSQDHAGGVAELLVGGWLASLPLALALGALLAAAERMLDAVESRLASCLCGEVPSHQHGSGDAPPAMTWLRPLAAAGLAFGLARRPPPVPALR